MTDAEILVIVRESCYCGRNPLGKPCARCAGNGARIVADIAALRAERDEWKARFTQWDSAKCSVSDHIFLKPLKEAAESERDALRARVAALEGALREARCPCHGLSMNCPWFDVLLRPAAGKEPHAS